MARPRFFKSLAAVALFNGALYLSLAPDAAAGNNEDDAKKYTQDLKKKDAKVRVIALKELGKLASIQKSLAEDAIPDVYKSLEDKDASVRAAAATCLGQCDQPADKAVPALVKLLKDDKEESVKIGAARGLAAMGTSAKSAVPTLRQIQKSADKKSPLYKATQQATKAINVKN